MSLKKACEGDVARIRDVEASANPKKACGGDVVRIREAGAQRESPTLPEVQLKTVISIFLIYIGRDLVPIKQRQALASPKTLTRARRHLKH